MKHTKVGKNPGELLEQWFSDLLYRALGVDRRYPGGCLSGDKCITPPVQLCLFSCIELS